MKKEVRLPEISENVEAGSVVQFLVSEGDTVEKEQPIVELETDKAAVEIPSDAAGVVDSIPHSEGDEVAVGDVILVLETEEGGEETREGNAEADGAAAGGTFTEAKREGEEKSAGEEQGEREEERGADEERESGESGRGSSRGTPSARSISPAGREDSRERVLVPAAPTTRRLARELGVDIREVPGSGPEARISREDVKAYTKEKMSRSERRGPAGYELPDFSRWGETRREPMSQVRRITAKNTVQSWTSVPHVTQFDDVDVTDVEEFRHRYQKLADRRGAKLTITAIITKIAGEALERFPRFNASLDIENEEIVFKDYISISVAVDTDRGLLVPVIRDANEKGIIDIAAELGELAERARSKKIGPDELEGGNFSISNLGGIGGTHFTPVIFPPQVAILGIGRAETRARYRDGEFVPRLVASLALSYDHRVIDGADGARFIRFIAEALESPMALLLEES